MHLNIHTQANKRNHVNICLVCLNVIVLLKVKVYLPTNIYKREKNAEFYKKKIYD